MFLPSPLPEATPISAHANTASRVTIAGHNVLQYGSSAIIPFLSPLLPLGSPPTFLENRIDKYTAPPRGQLTYRHSLYDQNCAVP